MRLFLRQGLRAQAALELTVVKDDLALLISLLSSKSERAGLSYHIQLVTKIWPER